MNAQADLSVVWHPDGSVFGHAAWQFVAFARDERIEIGGVGVEERLELGGSDWPCIAGRSARSASSRPARSQAARSRAIQSRSIRYSNLMETTGVW
jgi:hypothetical protein